MDTSDIRERHIGRITAVVPGLAPEVDVGVLVRRLLLFEHCVLESHRLTEIPALVAVFGARGLIDLVDEGAVSIVCDALTIGEIGRTDLQVTDRRGGPLPIGAYRLASVSMSDREAYLHGALQEVHAASISFKEAKRLKKDLAGRLLTYPTEAAHSAVETTINELLDQPRLITDAIRQSARVEAGVDPGRVDIHAERLEMEGDFRVSTTLGQQLRLEPEDVDHIVRRGLLAAAGLNLRVHLMERFGAVSGFQQDEINLFESKIGFLSNQLDPVEQERRFDRVISIGGLPSLRQLAPGIDVDQLLRLRHNQEWVDFRSWLRRLDHQTDEEIAAQFTDLRARAAEVLRSPAGKAVRFVVASAAGLVGLVPGLAVGGGDAFLLDKIVGRPGPAAFVSRWYPSIFREVASR